MTEKQANKDLNKSTDTNSQNTSATKKLTDIQNPELWDFPMDYPMSIIGHEGKHDELLNEVCLILATLFPDFDTASIAVKPSRTGRFHSLRLNLYLTEAQQVNDLYKALADAETVRTVL